MKQTDLNRAVARATGETVDQIRKLSFQLVSVPRAAAPRRQRQPSAQRAEASLSPVTTRAN